MGATETIYMPLEGEGVDVWRPVQAEHIAGETYRVVGPLPIPDDERWGFALGSIVRCKQKVFSGGDVGLVAYERVE